jgi:acetylornithine deacetylase
MAMEEVRSLALRCLAERTEQHVEMLRQLIRVPSPLGQERGAQELMAAWMGRLGLTVDSFDMDAQSLAGVPGYSPVDWSYAGRPNVVGLWKGSGGGRSLILNAHVDTTSAEPIELWEHDPYGGEVVDGRLYGRGAQDDKAGCIEILAVVQALHDAGLRLKGDLILESVIEDECTGNGTLGCVVRGYDADAALIVDGNALGPAIVGHPGQLGFRVTWYGRPAPGMAAGHGVNAIEKAAGIIAALRELEAWLNEEPDPRWAEVPHPCNLNIATIRGGEWLGNVPAKCTINGLLGFLPPHTLTEMRGRIEAAVGRAADADPWLREHRPRVTYNAMATDPVLYPEQNDFMRLLDRCQQEVLGQPLRARVISGVCDMRHFQLHRPTPTCLYGPGGGGNAHCPDEYFNLGELVAVAGVILAFVLDWCGYEA